MSKYLQQNSTTPITNVLKNHKLYLEYLDCYLNFTREIHSYVFNPNKGHRIVQIFREKLGKQSFTFTTYRKYWVWDYKNKGTFLRVSCNNEAGISLEVPLDTSEDSALKMAKNYFEYVKKKLKEPNNE